MRHLLLCLLAAVLAAGCSETGAIQGKIVVGKGHGGLSVVALIGTWEQVHADPNDPNSPLVEQQAALGQMPVGTTTDQGGDFPFTFHSLEAGKYWVGAYLDVGDDRRIDDDPLATTDTELVLDPSDPKKQVLTQDVFLETSAPDKGTLRGTLHLSQRAAAHATAVYVLDGPLSSGTSKVIAATRPAAGTDVPFEIFNVPPGNAYLMAVSDLNGDGQFSLDGDLVAVPADDPVQVDLGQHQTREGLEIWLDRQSPQLGRIQGQVSLNAAIPNVGVQLLVFALDPATVDNAPLVGLVNLAGQSVTTLPFDILSMPMRTLYLAALIHTVDPDGSLKETWRVYKLDDANSAKIELGADKPVVNGVDFELGVGRVSGSIKLANVPEGLQRVAVTANVRDSRGQIFIRQYQVFSFTPAAKGSTVNLSYELFGLEDGTFEMLVTPDMNDNKDFNDDLQSWSFPSTPKTVDVVAGGRVGADFSVQL